MNRHATPLRSPQSRVLRSAVSLALALALTGARAAELPQPCTTGACTGGPATWVTSGTAGAVYVGNRLQVVQQSQSAVLNWRSFNVDADGVVEFSQPSETAVALNRIFDKDPSRVLGSLSANGQVYLINTNGIVFGQGAKVNVGGLVASSLDITQQAVENGIARAVQTGAPAFAAQRDANGKPLAGNVTIERGASVTAEGGQVLVFAPEVTNRGVISTPDGQTVLAAGAAVYLAPSGDPNLRGLLVQVDAGGTVVNGVEGNRSVARPEELVGQIVSERGNVTLAGLAVKQLGRVSATTSVRANGTVRLQAADGLEIVPGPAGSLDLRATRGGELLLGERAVVEILPQYEDDSTQVDVNTQPRSSIVMTGRTVSLLENSRTVATSGSVSVQAQPDPRTPPELLSEMADNTRVYLAPGAVIDVSGAEIELPMERNVLRVELRGTQLADSPLQRDGPLRGETVFVDVRRSGTRSDGTAWRGTPLADLAGDIAAVGRAIGERSLAGGSISLQSQGSVLLDPTAVLDVSGGSIGYRDGYLDTTKLATIDGRPVDIGSADPQREYRGIVTSYTVTDTRWGRTREFPGFGRDTRGAFEAGFVEGKDAGSLTVVAPAVALDASVRATTVRGRYQRLPAGAVSQGSLYRPYDQVPLGAQLVLGSLAPSATPNRIVSDVVFEERVVLPGLTNPDGTLFDPLSDDPPAALSRVRLRPSLLGPDGISRLVVRANNTVSVPADVALTVPAGGSIDLAAGQTSVAGVLEAPSGSIVLAAESTVTTAIGSISLEVLPTSRLLARGGWVNDGPRFSDAGTAALHVNGGRITVASRQGSLDIMAGSLLDVTGGARLDASGRLRAGGGGSVTIGNTPGGDLLIPVPISVAGEIRGHSVDQGGRLSFTAGSVCIGSAACSSTSLDQLLVDPRLLEDSGFGEYVLASNRGGLEVAPGTAVVLRQLNLEPAGTGGEQPTGADLRDFSALLRREEYQQRPVNLRLTTSVDLGGGPFTNASFASSPGLTLGTGSLLDAAHGGEISLSSNSWMVVNGRVSTPAGRIDATLTGTLRVAEFLDAQAIWLGASSILAAPGSVTVLTNDRGQRSGEVRDAGTVAVRADRGYVVTLPGSIIDASGTSTTLDLRQVVGSVATVPTEVAGAAGAIEISAAEGILLNGTLRAVAAPVSGAVGGQLSVALDPGARVDPGSPVSLFPLGERRLALGAQPLALIVPERAAVPRALNGTARLDAQTVALGGFDQLSVRAAELYGRSTGPLELVALGRISIDGNAQFTLPRSMSLEAGRIGGGSGELAVQAPYVRLGNPSRQAQPPATNLAEGDAALRVEASLIDLVGHFGFDGLARATLSSSGDLRASGVQLFGARHVTGSLRSVGDLMLSASQVYPTTLSDYQIAVTGRADGRIDVGSSGAPGAVYSAGGRLQLDAPVIEHAGRLVAPLGEITLRGDAVTLAPGSVVSTSAGGRAIPFGEVQGGFDWTYSLLDQQALVVGSAGFELPRQRVLIDASDIRLDEGSTVDVSGGGDLLGYEWIAGVGGTRDLLSPLVRPNQFAILPTQSLTAAPLDASWGRNASIPVGSAVYLAGAEGVPEGTYALLPARYALLPGAFLVTALEGFQDLVPGETFSRPDGGTVVAGYRTVLGTDRRDSRYQGYSVRPGAAIQSEASYTVSGANEFLAERNDSGAPRLPRDAGLVSLAARQSLVLGAELVSQAASGGRGSGVDVSAQRLRIGEIGSVAGPDELLLDAEALRRLAAESLLIGGRRQTIGDSLLVEVSAETVTVDEGVELGKQELLFVALDAISIGADADLSAVAPGGVPPAAEYSRVLLDGDGALVRVAAGPQVEIARTAVAGLRGSVSVGAGASIRSSSGGSVAIDATRESTSQGTFAAPDGSLSLGSSLISLGGVPDGTGGLVLRDDDLARLGAAELILRSRSTIDLYGGVDLRVQRLILESGGLRAVGNDTVALLRSEGVARLSNPSALVTSAPVVGPGSLVVAAHDLELGEGSFGFDGFASVRLEAQRDIVSVASGTNATAGSLELSAARVTTVAGAERRLDAAADLRVTLPADPAVLPDDDAADRLGGVLEIAASRIAHSGRIVLPSGRIAFLARGPGAEDGILLGDGSIIDTAGVVIDFDSVALASPGGIVALEALNGGVRMENGASIHVSAGEEGAGALRVRAPNGVLELLGLLDGASSLASQGGQFIADARELSGFTELNARLDAGGFDALRDFRQRGAGALALDAGSTLRALDVRLAADVGDIVIGGTIDARGSDGGRIALLARDRVEVGGQLLASATATDGAGGRVELSADSESDGAVRLAPGALIDVRRGLMADPADEGRLSLRVARSRLVLDGGAVPGVELAGRTEGVDRVLVEGYRRYLDADGLITGGEVAAVAGNPRYADAVAFMSEAPAIEAAIGPLAELRPGIEVRSAGELALAADWNLNAWRFGGRPGVLTLRAPGDLRIDRSLSDGFSSVGSFLLPNVPGESWSYRLVAGADLVGADPLAVRAPGEVAEGQGRFVIAPGDFISTDPFTVSDFRMVRTGTGGIVIRAARDVELGNQVSVIYAAGVRGPGITIPDEFEGLSNLPYPVRGGDIDIAAGGTVRGAISPQLVTDWLWRVGAPFSAPTAWTVNYERFEQGVLSVGGDVRIRAGGNVENLSASVPAIGRQVGGLGAGQSDVEVVEGGSLRVTAGGSLLGGTYLVGNGTGRFVSGDRIATATERQDPNFRPLDPLFGLMGLGAIELTARSGARVESAFNPTLIPQGNAQNAFDRPTYFSSYDAGNALRVTAISGDVVMNSDVEVVVRVFRSLAAQTRDEVALRVLPPSLQLRALSRDVLFQGPLTLFPAPKGNLEVFAARDVTGSSANPIQIQLSGADPDYLPSIAVPQASLDRVNEVLSTPLTPSPNFNAAIPIHSDRRQPDGVPDTTPARVVARSGDIRLSPERIDDTSGFYLAKQGRFIAGGNIQDLSFVTQHVRATDVTTVQAGGDIRYRLGRTASGGVTDTRREIVVDGPGRLELIAGGDVNLQTSGGVTTRGNLRVSGLPEGGASVSVTAGIGGQPPDYAGFAKKYLVEADTFDEELALYVASVTGQPVTDKQDALLGFASLSEALRNAFLERVFLVELRESGRFAAASGNSDYGRGFEAIETLFPGGNPDVDAGEVNAYAGDLLMFFSRIYTLDGGDVVLLLPGGQINVGLASPPAAFGLQKPPSQLGLVVQSTGSVGAFSFGDFSVNESRVFAADGGDILVWSTRGDIDAGRGAKTAISAPPPIITFDPNGNPQVTFPAALTGSGIQTIATSPEQEPGDVDLYAPRGIVNAGDAGIVAGNLTIGATAVLGADNIQVTGVSVGVPVDSGGLGVAFAAVSSVGSSASQAATDTLGGSGRRDGEGDEASEADAALSWLDVFVIGLGEEQCDPKDLECIRRQRKGGP